MRKLLSLSIVASMLLFGCSKEPSTSVAPKAVENGGKTITVQLVDAATMRPVGDKVTVSIDKMRKHLPRTTKPTESNSISTTGYFTLGDGVYHHSFSAVENNGGTHGQNHIWIPVIDASMQLSTMCLEVSGNEATWSALVTQSSWSQFPVNTYLWWRVKDNGEGANAPADQRTDYYIYALPDSETGEPFDICDATGGDLFYFWDYLFEYEFQDEWSWMDVDEGGNIQVND